MDVDRPFMSIKPVMQRSNPDLLATIRKLLNTLDQREARILCLRYLDDTQTQTAIAAAEGVSKARISFLERRALSRLAIPPVLHVK